MLNELNNLPRSHSKSTVELGFEPGRSLEMGTETQASVQSQYVAQSLAYSRDTIYIWWSMEYTHSGCYIHQSPFPFPLGHMAKTTFPSLPCSWVGVK